MKHFQQNIFGGEDEVKMDVKPTEAEVLETARKIIKAHSGRFKITIENGVIGCANLYPKEVEPVDLLEAYERITPTSERNPIYVSVRMPIRTPFEISIAYVIASILPIIGEKERLGRWLSDNERYEYNRF